jgi:hypothetical protein
MAPPAKAKSLIDEMLAITSSRWGSRKPLTVGLRIILSSVIVQWG